MDSLKVFLNDVWSVFADAGLSEREVLAVLCLLVGLQVLFRLFSRVRRLKKVDYGSLSSRIDHLAIQLADLNSKLSRHLQSVEEKKNLDGLTGESSAAGAPRVPQGSKSSAAVQREPVLAATVSPPDPDLSDPLPDLGADLGIPELAIPHELPEEPRIVEPASAGRGIFSGLKKTRDAFRAKLQQVFAGRGITAETMDELEELLISSDLGVRASARLLEGLSLEAKARGSLNDEQARNILKEKVRGLLGQDQQLEIDIPLFKTKPVVILVVGVNGVGKTTTIGKLAKRFVGQGLKVTLAACDTFRAAAVEQIRVWGERSGVEVVSGDEGVKPTTVLYQAVEKVNARGDDVLIVDTAGRLHTRVNLMNELGSIVSMIERLCPGAPHESLLVVDATTGQNALEQAREFGKKVKLTGLIVTKLDGTPKGGIVVAIREELGIPIRYVGVGEGTEDLRVFRADEFVDALFDDAPDVYRGEQKRAVGPGIGLVH